MHIDSCIEKLTSSLKPVEALRAMLLRICNSRWMMSVIIFLFVFPASGQWTDSLEHAYRKQIDDLKTELDTIQDQNEQLEIMLMIGERYNWMLSLPDSSIAWYQRVRSTSAEENIYVARSFYYEAQAYYNMDKHHEMLAKTLEAKRLFVELSIPKRLADVLLLEGDCYGIIGPIDEGLEKLTQAEMIYDSIQDYEGAAYATSNMGQLCYDQGRYSEAIQYLLKSVDYRKKGNIPLSSGLLIRLGDTFKEVGNFDKAIYYFRWALSRTQMEEQRLVLGKAEMMQIACDAESLLSECFSLTNQPDSAFYHLDVMRRMSEELMDSSRTAQYYALTGDVFEQLSQKEKSKENYENALKLLPATATAKQRVEVLLGLSEKYLSDEKSIKANDLRKIEGLTREAYRLASESQLTTDRARAAFSLFRILTIRGLYAKANEFAEEYITLQDTLFQKDRSELFIDLQTKYETNRVETENALLQETQIAQAAQLKQQQYLIIGAVVVFFLVLVIAFVIYFSREKLKSANRTIQNALSEKELLLKEIHHRVKNNLQVVSSLLDMQSRNIEDEKALSTFMEGQNRVKAMALIHQKLYQNEGLATIDFRQYAEELLDELLSIYPSSKGVKTHIQSDGNDEFDIDTAVPLALILNELISNSLKYAFNENGVGQLNVSIEAVGEGQHRLTVSDNGDGLPEGFDFGKAKSLGLRLVRRLAKQLYGNVNYKTDQGAIFAINFTDTYHRRLA